MIIYKSGLWSLLCDAFCLVCVNWYTVLFARIRNYSNYAENIWHNCTKFSRPLFVHVPLCLLKVFCSYTWIFRSGYCMFTKTFCSSKSLKVTFWIYMQYGSNCLHLTPHKFSEHAHPFHFIPCHFAVIPCKPHWVKLLHFRHWWEINWRVSLQCIAMWKCYRIL
jgi:hypothetical protein